MAENKEYLYLDMKVKDCYDISIGYWNDSR